MWICLYKTSTKIKQMRLIATQRDRSQVSKLNIVLLQVNHAEILTAINCLHFRFSNFLLVDTCEIKPRYLKKAQTYNNISLTWRKLIERKLLFLELSQVSLIFTRKTQNSIRKFIYFSMFDIFLLDCSEILTKSRDIS